MSLQKPPHEQGRFVPTGVMRMRPNRRDERFPMAERASPLLTRGLVQFASQDLGQLFSEGVERTALADARAFATCVPEDLSVPGTVVAGVGQGADEIVAGGMQILLLECVPYLVGI